MCVHVSAGVSAALAVQLFGNLRRVIYYIKSIQRTQRFNQRLLHYQWTLAGLSGHFHLLYH